MCGVNLMRLMTSLPNDGFAEAHLGPRSLHFAEKRKKTTKKPTKTTPVTKKVKNNFNLKTVVIWVPAVVSQTE